MSIFKMFISIVDMWDFEIRSIICTFTDGLKAQAGELDYDDPPSKPR